jgi:predicted nucleic acid-binding protein
VKAYLDASVVLRSLLHEPGAIENWSRWEMLVTSELMRVECFRSLDRLRLSARLRDEQLADLTDAVRMLLKSFEQVPLEPAIQERAAGPFPSVIGTLDAIHLATALYWVQETGEPLLLVTHDAQLAMAARMCGLQVQTAP